MSLEKYVRLYLNIALRSEPEIRVKMLNGFQQALERATDGKAR